MTTKTKPYYSKTLEKGLIILDLFDRDHQHRGLSEISRLTGINKTSTYRLVNTLVQMGYLRKSIHNKSLRLGPRAFVLGHHFFMVSIYCRALNQLLIKPLWNIRFLSTRQYCMDTL